MNRLKIRRLSGIQGKLFLIIGCFVLLIGITTGTSYYVAYTLTHEAAAIDTGDDQQMLLMQKVERLKQVLIAAFGITLMISWLSICFARRWLVQPIRSAVGMIQELEQGNFDARLEIMKKHEQTTEDEIWVLAKALNLMTTKLGKFFEDIAEGVITLNDSSNQLSTISNQMSSSTEEASAQVYVIAASAAEMNMYVKTVVDTIGMASDNVDGIEKSIEQLAHTVTEIAQKSEKGRKIVGKAVDQANNASTIMNDLKGAANEVGNVTETINDISEQINLLALNATIEAARAGDAGRGFAVVASEIKDLARQTSKATDEIRERIESIQNTTAYSVSEIEGISTIITEVDGIVSTIANSVEEQSAATKEIAEKVVHVTQEIKEVDSSVNQSAIVTNEITRDISEISQSANEMAASSSQVNMNAEELTSLSDQLKGMILNYKDQHQKSEPSEPNEPAVSDDKSGQEIITLPTHEPDPHIVSPVQPVLPV